MNKKYLLGQFISGSVVMVVGTNAANALNYVYHLLMGRLLGPSNYGELASLISFITVVSMIPLALGLVVTKFISAAKDFDQLKATAVWLNNKVFIISLIITLTTVLLSPVISVFLNLNNYLLLFTTSLMFIFQIPLAFQRAILQGVLRFNISVSSSLIETSGKLILGITLVYLGFSTGGAILGLLIASVIAWIFTLPFIRKYLNFAKQTIQLPNTRNILLYSLPVIVQSMAITSLFSMDLVLVKHFLTPLESGLYAALSNLGKIIFFATSPIVLVMFPLISKKHSNGEEYKQMFYLSFLLILFIIVFISVFYWVYPAVAISLLYGGEYVSVAPTLPLFGIFMSLISLSYLLTNYFLSINKTRIVVLPLMAATAQIIGIILTHSSIRLITNLQILISGVLFVSLLAYFLYTEFVRND